VFVHYFVADTRKDKRPRGMSVCLFVQPIYILKFAGIDYKALEQHLVLLGQRISAGVDDNYTLYWVVYSVRQRFQM
jgi:hypothetical protein